jgi:hypothetical protein
MAINGPNPLNGVDGARVLAVPGSAERVGTPAPAEAESRFTPTADLAALLDGIRQTPVIRQEIIGEVARRLASGELLAPPATEATVQGILESKALS